jgi:GNAT superfamily N-acetyltransferase
MASTGSAAQRPAMSLGPFYVWRRGWPLPPVAARLDRPLTIESTLPPGPLGAIPSEEGARRLADGHALFAARIDGDLAGYGWSASRRAHIGGLDLFLTIPPDERYLWDFETMPAYRGRGVYPLLLQAILRRQSDEADGFWIGHDPRNDASRRGILKAGFRIAGHIWRLSNGTLAVVGAPDVETEVAERGAALFGLSLIPAPPMAR